MKIGKGKADCFFWFGVVIVGLSCVGLVVFLVQLGGAGISPFWPIDWQLSSRIGDYFGGIFGALWGLAATLLFFSSLRMQRKELEMNREELKLQREELALTREELKKQAEEQERLADETKAQADNMRMQIFERQFYNRLELLNNMIEQSAPGGYGAKQFTEDLRKIVEYYKRRPNDRYIFHEDYVLTLVSLVDYVSKSDFVDKFYYYGIINAQLMSEVKEYISFGMTNNIFINNARELLSILQKSDYFITTHFINMKK